MLISIRNTNIAFVSVCVIGVGWKNFTKVLKVHKIGGGGEKKRREFSTWNLFPLSWRTFRIDNDLRILIYYFFFSQKRRFSFLQNPPKRWYEYIRILKCTTLYTYIFKSIVLILRRTASLYMSHSLFLILK